MPIKMYSHAILLVLAGAVPAAPLVLMTEGSLEDSSVVAEMTRYQLAAGDRLMSSRKFGSAEAAYRTAISLERTRGTVPLEASRRLANARYFRGDYAGAARVLVDLAGEAGAAGDRQAEFWALMDAAWLDRLADDAAGLREHVTRAQLLLDEGVFPDARLDRIVQTVTDRDLRPFAPHLSSW